MENNNDLSGAPKKLIFGGNEVSDHQKELIYELELEPLKRKISDVLLYDSEAGTEFLRLYYEIANAETVTYQIYGQILDLEWAIEEYEREEGNMKKNHNAIDEFFQ